MEHAKSGVYNAAAKSKELVDERIILVRTGGQEHQDHECDKNQCWNQDIKLVLSKKIPILYSEENLCFKAKIIEYPE